MGEQQRSLAPGTSGEPSWATVAVTTLRLWRQRHTHRGRRPASRRQRGVLVLSAAVAMAFGALVTLAFTHQGEQAQKASSAQSADPAPSTRSALQTAAANRSQAADWIAQQILPSVLIGCDPLMCQALEAANVSASRLSLVQPSAPDPLGVEVIVATPALQSQFGPRLASALAPSGSTSAISHPAGPRRSRPRSHRFAAPVSKRVSSYCAIRTCRPPRRPAAPSWPVTSIPACL
jgi:hypothetical protein